MAISTYKKKLEAYIKSKETAKPRDGESAKGLLAPKSPMDKSTKGTSQDSVANVGEFIYALRQKRQEFKLKNKGTK
jgi:hypothetical protein